MERVLSGHCRGSRVVVFSISILLLLNCFASATIQAQTRREFLVGINYPWAGYGHDFGKNGWGHDGVITGGWSYQTFTDSQGFTDTRFCKTRSHTGTGSLCITASLLGQDSHKSKGEVFIDLRNHHPQGLMGPLNLSNATVRCWVFLPAGSSGLQSAPNGIQLFFKSDGFYSLYGPFQNIQPSWENQWVELTANASGPGAFMDPQYDPTRVVAIGLKVGINAQSVESLNGTIYLDDFTLGVAVPVTLGFETLEIESDLAVLRQSFGQSATPVVRIFVFADGRAAPDFGSNGDVTGLDEYFFQDFDSLLEISERQNFMLIPVLLDFSWFDLPVFEAGVQLGGRSNILRDQARRQTFMDSALVPLVQRYCSNPRILAWEVINEPEWAMAGVSDGFQVSDPVAISEMQQFVQQCATAIHACTSQRVTVGSARRLWLSYWQGLGLDLYQYHWYDHFAQASPPDTFPWPPYSGLNLDKPCLVGEVPTANTQHSTREYLNAAFDGGYSGLLNWSYRAGDTFSNFPGAERTLRTWCRNISSVSSYIADFDADGKTEMGFYRSGLWGILKSSQAFSTNSAQFFSWGGARLQPILADFDGDHKADIAYIVPPAGGQSAVYAILKSSTNYDFGQPLFTPAGFPSLGDTPVVGDFDGDGKADPAIWRETQGVWIVPKSSTNYTTYIFTQWGTEGDIPVTVDLDGDGKADIGFYRDGLWGFLLSSQGYSFSAARFFDWGGPSLQPIAADFDGDGKADIAYVAPPAGGQSAVYSILLSSRSYSFAPGQPLFVPAGWPSLGDTPVTGDWDGDGKADPGVWRESQGAWILPKSSTNYAVYTFNQWGQGGDILVPDGSGRR